MTQEKSISGTSLLNRITALWKKLLGETTASRKRHWVDYAFIIAFILLVIITASMSDVFFTQRNLSNLLRQTVTNGLLSLGSDVD
jgi:ABC-type xylose transport system permease subunit